MKPIDKGIIFLKLNEFNSTIFNGDIKSIDSLRIIWRNKPFRGIKAFAWYYPESHIMYLYAGLHKNRKMLFATLAHELIHVYQKECGFNLYKLNHGGRFFNYWADKVCSTYLIERKGF